MQTRPRRRRLSVVISLAVMIGAVPSATADIIPTVPGIGITHLDINPPGPAGYKPIPRVPSPPFTPGGNLVKLCPDAGPFLLSCAFSDIVQNFAEPWLWEVELQNVSGTAQTFPIEFLIGSGVASAVAGALTLPPGTGGLFQFHVTESVEADATLFHVVDILAQPGAIPVGPPILGVSTSVVEGHAVGVPAPGLGFLFTGLGAGAAFVPGPLGGPAIIAALAPIPEPATLALFGVATAGLFVRKRFRPRQRGAPERVPFSRLSSVMTLCVTLWAAPSVAEPILPVIGADNSVTWSNDKTDKSPVKDIVPIGGSLFFRWTEKGVVSEKYGGVTFGQDSGGEAFNFYRPNDPVITDWRQTLKDQDGESVVVAGNIKQQSPWQFFPLSDLPTINFSIPDLAASGGNPTVTIFTAVNLDLYLAQNPSGFLGGAYQVGDTLDGLGLTIADGMISGLQGIYFATTDFVLDPLSLTGWVPIGGPSALLDSATFQATFGPIRIIGIHEGAVPEPATTALMGIAVLLGCASRERARHARART
jgi:hypothetical protein